MITNMDTLILTLIHGPICISVQGSPGWSQGVDIHIM